MPCLTLPRHPGGAKIALVPAKERKGAPALESWSASLVPGVGLEPTRGLFPHWILSPARLPIPPPRPTPQFYGPGLASQEHLTGMGEIR